MTNQHPITPPPELWKQFAAGAYTWKEAVTYAYRAGADQELEACCDWLVAHGWFRSSNSEALCGLRAARRPKPPSLKAQALSDFDGLMSELDGAGNYSNCAERIRCALEQLDD